MIVRIDNRFIHGQILSTWVPRCNIQTVIVMDDEIAASDFEQEIMLLAVPPEVDARVVSRKQGLELFDGHQNTMILLKNVADAFWFFTHGVRFPVLNVGNIHQSPERTPVTPSVALSPLEFKQLQEMNAGAVKVELQTLPTQKPLILSEIAHLLGV